MMSGVVFAVALGLRRGRTFRRLLGHPSHHLSMRPPMLRTEPTARPSRSSVSICIFEPIIIPEERSM
jgi:hypothetical protein